MKALLSDAERQTHIDAMLGALGKKWRFRVAALSGEIIFSDWL
jgi:hypothetical protein